MKRPAYYLPTACLGLLAFAGCSARNAQVSAPTPLGAEVDNPMMQQEHNAEAAKFVVYMHEFELNRTDEQGREHGWRLNEDGEDHLKQIAMGIKHGIDFPVVVERSRSSVKAGTDYEFPVHYNEELDAKRRTIIVAVLERMGVADAEQRVVVAPAFSEGFTGTEASRAYNRGINGGGVGGGGGGAGGGGAFGGGGGGMGGGGY